jgi:hypothetical protein
MTRMCSPTDRLKNGEVLVGPGFLACCGWQSASMTSGAVRIQLVQANAVRGPTSWSTSSARHPLAAVRSVLGNCSLTPFHRATRLFDRCDH